MANGSVGLFTTNNVVASLKRKKSLITMGDIGSAEGRLAAMLEIYASQKKTSTRRRAWAIKLAKTLDQAWDERPLTTERDGYE